MVTFSGDMVAEAGWIIMLGGSGKGLIFESGLMKVFQD